MAVVSRMLLDEEVEDWSLPIWREAFMGVDWIWLRSSPVYYGFGVPWGDKSAVVVVPGFMGHDIYLTELYAWLWRMRYKPYMSHIGRNAECPNLLIERLLKTIDRAYKRTGRPVHLIGHSLGGVLAMGAVPVVPERIASIITMGSPIRGPKVHPWVLKNARKVRQKIRNRRNGENGALVHKDCFTYKCSCGFAAGVRDNIPPPMPLTAMYSRRDGIVDWHMCLSTDTRQNVEVRGTHCGMAWNPQVYKTIAKALHAAKTD